MDRNSKRSPGYRPLQEGGGLTPRGESGRQNLLRTAVYSFSLLLSSLFGTCADGSSAEASFHLAENLSNTVGGDDLTTYAAGSTTLNLTWTQVSDATGNPAHYTDTGAQVEHSYSATGTYGVTLTVTHDDAVIQSDTTSVVVEDSRTAGHSADEGIWISSNELSARTTSGNAWGNVKAEADGSCGSVDLSDQHRDNNVCILAKALVHARIGEAGYRSDVVSAIQEIANMGTYDGRALALGRGLGAYAIAADLIGLTSYDSSLDSDFRAKLRELLTTYTHSGPSSLIECHEDRPNNWGTHCGASRAAVAVYLGDEGELERTAKVFRGWLGDRSSYAGFSYGDLSWQCDEDNPVGINPLGCTKDGHDIDGVLPDDQRRGGRFTWPPPKENYVWEALQGALVQAAILHRAGYNVFEWQDRALYRAVRWLHETARYPAEGDDEWQPHLVNHFYGTALPAPVPARSGKNMGWTDWTHR